MSVMGGVIQPDGEITFVQYETPKDFYQHTHYTICGASIENNIVLIQQEEVYYKMTNTPMVENKEFRRLYEMAIVKDEMVYGPLFVMQTDEHGEPIDIDKSLFK